MPCKQAKTEEGACQGSGWRGLSDKQRSFEEKIAQDSGGWRSVLNKIVEAVEKIYEQRKTQEENQAQKEESEKFPAEIARNQR